MTATLVPAPNGPLTTAPVAIAPADPFDRWEAKLAFAEFLVKSGFCPESVKTKEQALAIILTGQELGIPPMNALRSIHVIRGKPTMAAELMLALFAQKGGRHKWVTSTETKAELWLAHPNGTEHTETYTLDDAKRAPLTGKDAWKTNPKQMLRWRATSNGLRACAPDIVGGLYEFHEADDLPAVAPPTLLTQPGLVAFWLDLFRDAATLEEAARHWARVTLPDTWATFPTSDQHTLTDAYAAAQARLTPTSLLGA